MFLTHTNNDDDDNREGRRKLQEGVIVSMSILMVAMVLRVCLYPSTHQVVYINVQYLACQSYFNKVAFLKRTRTGPPLSASTCM